MEDKLAISENCRFCAKQINSKELVKIKHNLLTEVYEKLNSLNLILYAHNQGTFLPFNVCYVCWHNFTAAYEFFETFREAQDRFCKLDLQKKLKTFETTKNEEKILISNSEHDQKDPKFDEEEDDQPLINIQLKLHVKSDLPDLPSVPSSQISQIKVKVEKSCSTNSWVDYPWLCKNCKAVLPDIESLREHWKTEHLLCPQFVCIDCKSYKYRNFNNFIFHIMTHRRYLK